MQAIGIISTPRKTYSVKGNPCYTVILKDAFTDVVLAQGKTKPNAQFCFDMPRTGVAFCTWHGTNSGHIVFTNIARVKVPA